MISMSGALSAKKARTDSRLMFEDLLEDGRDDEGDAELDDKRRSSSVRLGQP
jgi:hypothetical protein